MTARPQGDDDLLDLAMQHSPAVAYVAEWVETLRITRITPNLEGLIGVRAATAVADPEFFKKTLLAADFDRLAGSITDLPFDGRPVSLRYRVRRADGRLLWVRDTVRLIERDGARIVLGCMSAISDTFLAGDDQRHLVERNSQPDAIADSALDCIISIDDNGRVIAFNNAAEDAFGYSRDEAIGRDVADLIIPQALRERHHRGRERYLATGEHTLLGERIEIDAMRSNGEIFPVEISVKELKIGEQRLFTAFIRDITERRAAEAQQRENEEQLRGIIQAIPLPTVISRLDTGEVVLDNTRSREVFGITVGNRDRRPLYAKPEERDRIVDQVIRTGAVTGFEVEMFARDGAPFWAMRSSRRISYHGSPAMVSVVADISERKRMEEELRARDAQQRAILDHIPARVVYVDTEGKHVYANRHFSDFVQLPEEAVLGRSIEEILGRPMLESLSPFLERALAGESVEWEGWTVYPGIGRRYVFRVYQPHFAADGSVEGCFIFVHDITEQKNAEEALQRQREIVHQNEKLAAVGSLLAGVSHELNNPLSVVVGRTIMLEDEVTDPRIAEAVGKIRVAAERCSRIVKSFLEMARQQEPHREAVDLVELVHAALEIVEHTLEEDAVETRLALDEGIPKIQADSDQLTQVIVNLCINAAQAMRSADERILRVSTGPGERKGEVCIEVSDTGTGIAKTDLTRIFDPFFSTKPADFGTGIGLSVCRGIVDAHGGKIAVSSEEGNGTTFLITLPVSGTRSGALGAPSAATTADP